VISEKNASWDQEMLISQKSSLHVAFVIIILIVLGRQHQLIVPRG